MACYRSGSPRRCPSGSSFSSFYTPWVAIKFREVRKFLAVAFFSALGYFGIVDNRHIGFPLCCRTLGISVEAPEICGQRAIVHFILVLLCLYFGFFSKRKDDTTEA